VASIQSVLRAADGRAGTLAPPGLAELGSDTAAPREGPEASEAELAVGSSIFMQTIT
jgi:hypothetical protein